MTPSTTSLLAAVLLGVPAIIHCQITYSAWSGAEDATFTWRTDGNWTSATYPDSAEVVAVFDGTSNATGGLGSGVDPITWVNVSMVGGTEQDWANVDMAGVILGSTNSVDRYIRSATNGTFGYHTLHGFPQVIGDRSVTALIVNDSAGNTLRYRGNFSTQVHHVRLMTSGAIHVANPDARVWFTVPIAEGPEPVTITKTGAGILQFGIDVSSWIGRNATTGGLVIEEGVVRSSLNSAVENDAIRTSPYGLGPIILRGGALQPSSTTNRTIHNGFIIEGDFTFGSLDPTFSGNHLISQLGRNVTELTREVTLTVLNTTTWRQDILGYHRIIKQGAGELILEGVANAFAALTLREGVVAIGSSTSGSAPASPSVSDGVMVDHLRFEGGTLRFTGSWSGTPMSTRRGIALGPAGGTIEVLSGLSVQANGPMADAELAAGAFTKSGDGIFILASTSTGGTYSGPTRVEQGQFIMNSILPSSTVDVLAGASLGGIGTFGQAITVRAGASLLPGGRLTPGRMVAEGPVTLETGSTLVIRITGPTPVTEHDVWVCGSNVNLGEVELDVQLGYQPTGGPAYVLIDNRSGVPFPAPLRFGGEVLTEGSEFTVQTGDFVQRFAITYAYSEGDFKNSVALVAVGNEDGTYNSWRQMRFGDLLNPDGAPLVQLAGQPVANLLIHALGVDLAAQPTAALPQVSAANVLSFTRRMPLMTSLFVEATNGHPSGTWDILAVFWPSTSSWTGVAPVSEVPAGPGRTRVNVTDPAPPAGGTRLLRVRASAP